MNKLLRPAVLPGEGDSAMNAEEEVPDSPAKSKDKTLSELYSMLQQLRQGSNAA